MQKIDRQQRWQRVLGIALTALLAGVQLQAAEATDEWATFSSYFDVDYDQSLRPQFHFTSRKGWLNDPNGMVYYDGEWHMLFQHFAKGNKSGAKSWGNALSTDLMQWTQLPHAINPYPRIDGTERIHAIWSGSAVVDEHNALGKQKGDLKTLFALYSATHDKFFQGGAYSTDKGRTWTKINDGKPVIPHQEGFSKGQRDPRIFYYAPGKFYVTIMMIGGPERKVRLWKSTDLLNWKQFFDIPNKAAECIDMYHVSVDGDPNKRKWVIADAGTHYEVGDFNGESWTGFGAVDKDGKRLKFDYGDAYYAAQAFNQGPDGRVVHIGWLRSKQAGYRPFLDAGMPFTQQMSIPAEITLKTTPNGIRMYRNPVKEIEKLYAKSSRFTSLSAKALNEKLATVTPELIDLTLRAKPTKDFTLSVRGLDIHWRHAKQAFEFTNLARLTGEKAAALKHRDPRKRNYRDKGLRTVPAPLQNGQVSIRALVDRASLELFVNDGQAAASFVVVPEASNRTIAVQGDDGLAVDAMVVNELKSAWSHVKKVSSTAAKAKVPVAANAPKAAPAIATKGGQRPPNVVVIFIDDMGYGDIGPFGAERSTPHLDRMAAEGMKLTNFYVSSSACTPSRAALLTGCYADRIEMGRSVVFPADERGLNPSEITIAEVLKQGGYATGCFGKWHLGDQAQFMPLAQGFDEYQGIPYSNDMWVKGNPRRNYPPLPWIVQDKPVAHVPDVASQDAITDAVTDAAVDFIKRHKDRPFFAYVPHSAVHAPHTVTPERLAAANGDVMTALITEIDNSTGRILQTLRELGLDDDTFVLFTNDNGGAGKTSPGPLRGHKFGHKYEGHMRVATLAWWPGKIPAGSVTHEIGATIDVLPTIAGFAGLPTPKDRIIDGNDLGDLLLAKPGAKSPHEWLYYENDGIRRGKWKLVSYLKRDKKGTPPKQYHELYDLDADLGEAHNLAAKHPDVVKELKAALEKHVASIAANIRKAGYATNPKPLLASAQDLPTLAELRKKKVAKPPTPAANKAATNAKLAAALAPNSRTFTVTGKNLLLPVIFPDRRLPKAEQEKRWRQARLSVIAPDGKTLLHKQGFDYPLNLKNATYWGYLDVAEYLGKTITVRCDRPGREALLKHLKFSDEQGEYHTPLYSEKLRPQYHFTPKQGWNNDPNGLYYHDGLYHMSFQNGALNRGWGNIYWGHAVSKDLLHWQESNEWPRVLRSGGGNYKGPRHPALATGSCFSGGAVVDHNNTLGVQKPGGPKTVVVAYTDSSGLGECLAYSNDGGHRFQKLEEGTPAFVLPNRHNPEWKKSWGRDPKPFWHEPSKHWVIVTYLMGQDPKLNSGHMAFYVSKDLKNWAFASKTEKLFPETFPDVNGKRNPASRDPRQKDFHECPDFFQLPVDGDAKNKKWVLIGGAMKYQVGDFDGRTFTPDQKQYHQGMFGSMKAGQAFSHDPKGRAVYVLWSRLRTNVQPLPPFAQGITLPIEFKLASTDKGLRLRYLPIEEMRSIRGTKIHQFSNVTASPEQPFSFTPKHDLIEVEIFGRSSSDASLMLVQFGDGNELQYDLTTGTQNRNLIEGCPKAGEPFSMRFYIDRAQWNLFFNNGLSYQHYARRDGGAPLNSFRILTETGTIQIDKLTVHKVKSVWKK